MKKLKIASHFSDDSLKKLMNSQTEVRAFKGWQIIYSVKSNPDKSSDEIAQILGICKSKVLRIVGLYNKQVEKHVSR